MSVTVKSFEATDDIREMPKVKVHMCDMGSAVAAKMIVQPGWSWSKCIKPIVGTESCMAKHVGCLVSGCIHVKMDNGTETDIHAGDAYVIVPGHDGWVVGDEEAVGYEFNTETAKNFGTKN